MVSVLSVARTLGRMSGWSLSNLALQKIAFIAEMLHLGRTGWPLTSDQWQAWSYGPVQPTLYHRAKAFGTSPVKDIFQEPFIEAGTSQYKAISDAFSLMKGLSPGKMINVTHQAEGAWAKSYNPLVKNKTIPKDDIKAEYGSLITDDD